MTNPNHSPGGNPAMRGFNRVTDNVARRHDYEHAHPHVVISHTDDPWWWVATWYDHGTQQTIGDGELGGLLDQLESRDL